MPARFCPHCGTKALAGGKFCSECGASLHEGVRPSGRAFHVTGMGAGVLGFFLLAGMAMWAAILSPSPPRPVPGSGGPRAGAGSPSATAAADAPAAPSQKPIALPAEVKSFIADLAAKAKEKPKDVDSWAKLGMVNARAAQLDPSYADDAMAAFNHVLEIDPKHPDALRGIANIHYDREEHAEAIPFFERYLAIRPDDASARTDLATMYLYTGDGARSIATYQEVLRRNPGFLQAHYNLAVAYHREGNQDAALGELETARGLATEDTVRKQIDDMIARLKGGGLEAGGSGPAAGGREAPPGDGKPVTPFQAAVEKAFRAHPIMGPRIAGFEWTGVATGRVLMRDFPMDSMPPAVREKFAARLGQELATAKSTHGVDGPVRMEIADATSGTVMATVTP
jgi:Flp pilus assembly protein TadD